MEKIDIQTSEFTRRPQGDTTKGFVISDGYAHYCDDTWEDIPDDNMTILKRIVDDHKEMSPCINAVTDTILFIWQKHCDVTVNEQLFHWEHIRQLFD